MVKSFSFLKDAPARILFFIFLANVFYDDPTLYLYKRIIYSICAYYSIYEILKFIFEKKSEPDSFRIPFVYNVYIPLLIIFVMIALSKDLVNPSLKWITLLNNPFAMLMVFPILLFIVGTQTEDIAPIYKVLVSAIVVFVIVVALPVFGKVKFYQGYICANAFIPFFFISDSLKKHRTQAIILLVVGVIFSQISDYRIIALRIFLFFSLYVGFLTFKKFGILKALIIAAACFGLYQFLTNIQDILYLFKDIIGVKSFDDDDTRGFLYQEVWGELNGAEYIFGRGFVGTYFSEYFLMLLVHYRDYADHFDRFTVEVGFLELLLKGGFFGYILFISPLLYTFLRGIFRKFEDPLVYCISIFIFTELLLMYIENIPYFSFQYSQIFFLAGFAIRRMSMQEESEQRVAESGMDLELA